jgi:predicted ArsR family transcriptional regulator
METHLSKTVQLAREAGIDAWWDSGSDWRETFNEHLKAFEALVRADAIADEREACAKVCEAEAEMFKSCADGANDGRYDWKEDGARDCAVALRSRSSEH